MVAITLKLAIVSWVLTLATTAEGAGENAAKQPYLIHVELTMSIANRFLKNSRDTFEVYDEIAHGSFGAVLAAKHVGTGTEVAIKKALHEDNQDGFNLEWHMYHRLNAIVGPRDKETTDAWRAGILHAHAVGFVVDSLTCDAPPLAERIWLLLLDFVKDETKNVTNETEWALIRLQRARSLKYIHSKDIRHADIKPKNFLYSHALQKSFVFDYGLSEVNSEEKTTVYEAGIQPGGTPRFFTSYMLYLMMQKVGTPNLKAPGPESDWEALVYTFLEEKGHRFPWVDHSARLSKICFDIRDLNRKIRQLQDKKEKERRQVDLAILHISRIKLANEIYWSMISFGKNIKSIAQSNGLSENMGKIMFAMLRNIRACRDPPNKPAITKEEVVEMEDKIISWLKTEYDNIQNSTTYVFRDPNFET